MNCELKSDFITNIESTGLHAFIQSKCPFRHILHSKSRDALILRQDAKAITIMSAVLVT